MISLWILYAVTVSLLFGLAALLAERVLLWYRLPTRWVWASAMGASLLLPALFFLMPRAPAPAPDPVAGVALEEGFEVGLGALKMLPQPSGYVLPRAEELMQYDGAVLAVWLIGSAFLALLLAASVLSLRGRRGRWRRETIEGRQVLLSRDLGPAVVGLRRPVIVLPEWALALGARALDLILAHEEEHVAARDTILLCGALVLVVLAPWNLPLWWHFRRLRLAVECDCDRRVLGRGVQWNEYGALLVSVGQRSRGLGMPAAALAESSSLLERRLTMMNTIMPAHRRGKTLLAVGVAIFLIALACEAPLPTASENPAPVPDETVVEARDISETPAFVPHTVSPTVRNRETVEAALNREYPETLREAGIGGVVLMHFFVGESGSVLNTVIQQSSGHSVLDQAAYRVAEAFEFSPAFNRDQPTAVWVSIPIRFTTGDAPPAPTEQEAEARRDRSERLEEALRERSAPGDLPPAPPSGAADTPVFVPHTVSPTVRNRQEVERALIREYPDALRQAQIGGTVLVHFHVGETGRVMNAVIQESSGHGALDEAALRVAEVFDFNPAMNRDEHVAVWVSMPIRFTTRAGEVTPTRQPLTREGAEPGEATSTRQPLVRELQERAGAIAPAIDEAERTLGLSGERIQLRADRTGAQPLYIVDGVILSSAYPDGLDLDRLDVESIEVVKGAAASRLYGERATHGVIQITTRR